MYTIGRLARRAKVTADSIRFYERQGLLAPANKTDSGYRLYADDALRRIAFIKHAQRCGFSLAEIGELLQMHGGDHSARAKGRSLAAQKCAEMQQTMEVLQTMTEALKRLLGARRDDGRGADNGGDSALLSAFEADGTQRRINEVAPTRSVNRIARDAERLYGD